MAATLDQLTSALKQTSLTPGGVSFAGKGLKLNTAEDAKEIVEAINNCKDLQSLNLEGNTLGIEAAKAISAALATKSEFTRALWKDLFTGRMKDEIPIALKHLGNGLVAANAKLVELDLSDNAFGPIGVDGLVALLRSPCCYHLEELRLNNNGLGIGGGKLLADALLDCYNNSQKIGKPFALRVFIAGRNRLENPGATELAKVFKAIGTLENISMPQNGIYHVGITALAESFKSNPKLKVLNLNDNTIGWKGAQALSKVIPKLNKLQVINFGDCLLKTKGTVVIADSLVGNESIEEIYLDCNEIKYEAAEKLINILAKKVSVKKLSINGNCFGEEGCKQIIDTLQTFGKTYILDSLDEDEGEDDEDNEEDSANSTEEIEEEIISGVVSVDHFMASPSLDNLIALGEKRNDLLLSHTKTFSTDNFIQSVLSMLMHISSLSTKTKQESVKTLIMKCCDQLWVELFDWSQKHDKVSLLNNTLLVCLCLIKSENKFVPSWDIEGCFKMLESVVKKNYFPGSTRDVLRCFIERDVTNKMGKYLTAKSSLLLYLH